MFNNLTIGNKQQVGIMTVYPLIGEDSKVEFANFEDIQFNGTVNYGTMSFSNRSEKPFILPTGYAIMTKQAAQDHALIYAEYLEGFCSRKEIHTACCVQQTQGGYISPIENPDISILPLNIRKNYLSQLKKNNVEDYDFSKLWDLIIAFQNKLTKSNEGNLILFFNKYLDKLSKFNAEFESVPNQRGAIILINDKIVGIEVVPSNSYWKKIWNSLIRDCYGSEVLRLTELSLVKTFEEKIKNNLDYSSCNSVEEIENLLSKSILEDKNKMEEVLFEIDLDSMSQVYKKPGNSYEYNIKRDSTKCTEYYKLGEEIVYLSMLYQ